MPDNPKITQGITAAIAGNDDEATRLFREAVAEEPDIAPPGLDVAGRLANSSDDSRAEKVMYWIEKTAEDFPNDPEAFLLLAELAIDEQRYVEAGLLVKHAEPLVAAMPDKSLRKIPLTGRSMLIYVSMAENRNRWAEAVELLQKMIVKWSDRTELVFRLGRDQFKSGKRDDGIATIKKWAEQTKGQPNEQSVTLIIFGLYENEGLHDDAWSYLEQAIKTEPENVRLQVQASQIKLRQGELDTAKKFLETAIKLAPTNPFVERQQAVIALYDKDFAKAEKLFEMLLIEYPADRTIRSGLALALCSQDNSIKLKRAVQLVNESYRNNPDDIETAESVALVSIWQGNTEFAEQILTERFDRGEMSPVGAYYIALVYNRSKRKEEAKIFLEASLSGTNFPQRADAEKLKEELDKD
jgi:tetratricopeptide (TPR) repeat protein